MLFGIGRRLASRFNPARHTKVVDDFLQTAKTAPPIIRKQSLDQNQIQCLSLTLNRPRLFRSATILKDEIPPNGTPISPSYHLAYFTPAALLSSLGRDGTYVSYSPAESFT